MALLVEVELRLTTVEGYCTLAVTLLAECLCKVVKCQNLLLKVALACLDYRLRLLIGEATVGVNYRTTKPLLQHFALLVDMKYRRKGELILVWSE